MPTELSSPVTPAPSLSSDGLASSSLSRRDLLGGLARIGVVIGAGSGPFMAEAGAQDAASDFLGISRTITGSNAITADVAARIRRLLAARHAGGPAAFDAACAELWATLRAAGSDREARLAALSDSQVAFALQIAKPWYVGHVGDPSDQVFDDDAEFATFLQAQASEKIIDVVPRTTYPYREPGWWSAPPPGIDAPPMPAAVRGWTFQPNVAAAIRPPAAPWKTYASATFATLAAARAAQPNRGADDETADDAVADNEAADNEGESRR